LRCIEQRLKLVRLNQNGVLTHVAPKWGLVES
jgi:hypothetical protein